MSIFPGIKMGVLADIAETITGITCFILILKRNKKQLIKTAQG